MSHLFLVGVDHAGTSTQLMSRDTQKDNLNAAGWDARVVSAFGNGREIRQHDYKQIARRYVVDVARSVLRGEVVESVREFRCLYEENWIIAAAYRNWCPKLKTVLSDWKYKEEKNGNLFFNIP